MSKTKTIAVGALCALAATTTSATAASVLTSKQIADGTITNRDIHRGTISENRLAPAVRAKLNKIGQPGRDGTNGAAGAKGDTGQNGVNGTNGTNGVAGKDFNALPEDFSTSSYGVDSAGRSIPATMTAGGVKFGPYPEANEHSGSLVYTGFDGKLSDLKQLSYTTKHSTDDHAPSAPYLRVYLDNGSYLIFSPVTQPDVEIKENTFQTWNVTGGTVRVGDDFGNESDVSWETALETAGPDHKVTAIKVTAGYAGGKNLKAFVSDLSVNGKAFHFGS